MLILTRKLGESIAIGNDIKITLLEIKGRQIRIGIEAPPQCDRTSGRNLSNHPGTEYSGSQLDGA